MSEIKLRIQDKTGHSECVLQQEQALERAQELEQKGYYMVYLDGQGNPQSKFVSGETQTIDAISGIRGG